MAPKGIQVLIFGTHECYLLWQRAFAALVKERLFWWALTVMTGVLIRGKQKEI